ncbi:MAG: hypothetical protein UU72_C0037G0005 [candidate division WWE3 bacterium GW2011_GWB1_41_6]|uniref:Uncharacterized protein n=1 Tax=candidate division WWE3 bacterium GW2011_GWB1_41_6 TaxID=1619112 RepID=A0A0G0WTD8_UNCKA|nr:MAG: hypothetical protein UU72_C0037G0005 [candidate division WWE3 bacterium GW2011_GWB1_41_6]
MNKVQGRMGVYRDRAVEAIRKFKSSGYPATLSEAVHFYAVYRELGLSFQLGYVEWETLWRETISA